MGIFAVIDALIPAVEVPALVWLGIFIVLVVVAQFMAFHEKREESNETEERIRECLEPRLDIVFGQGHPFEELQGPVSRTDIPARLFRVGVQNMAKVTLDDVVVQLERADPVINPLPIELRQKDDNPSRDEPYKLQFRLNPGQTQYFDVVWKNEGAGPGKLNFPIVLCYAVKNKPNSVPPQRLELIILASARGTLECRKPFVVDVDEEGHLRFQPTQASAP